MSSAKSVKAVDQSRWLVLTSRLLSRYGIVGCEKPINESKIMNITYIEYSAELLVRPVTGGAPVTRGERVVRHELSANQLKALCAKPVAAA